MSLLALDSEGTTLAVGDGGSPENFDVLGEVTNLGGPGGGANVKDVTDLSSTAREKTMGLPDEGQMNITMFYIPSDATHKRVRDARSNRTLLNFELNYSDGATKDSFSGYVINFPVDNSVDANTTANVVIEITGAVTTTP